LGRIRGSIQKVSYEIILFTIVFIPLLFFKSFSFNYFVKKGNYISTVNILLLILFIFIFLCETKRAPFDFSEGERELVSGFKTEFSALSFIFLQLAEYGNILFVCYFIYIRLIGISNIFIPLRICVLSCFILVPRGALPRFRYDLLMKLR